MRVYSPPLTGTPLHTGFGEQPPELPPPRVSKSKRPPLKAPILPPPKDLPPVKDIGNVYPAESEEQQANLSLTDFVTKHGDSLPRRVVVKEGFCGTDERYVSNLYRLGPLLEMLCSYI